MTPRIQGLKPAGRYACYGALCLLAALLLAWVANLTFRAPFHQEVRPTEGTESPGEALDPDDSASVPSPERHRGLERRGGPQRRLWPTGSAARAITVVGRCIASDTAEPVNGCEITLATLAVPPSVLGGTVTDAEGRFTLTARSEGIHFVLNVVHPQFVGARHDVSRPAGQGPIDVGDLELTRGARVSGILADENGNLLSGYGIAFMGSRSWTWTSSGHDGTFTIDEPMMPGVYSLEVRGRELIGPTDVTLLPTEGVLMLTVRSERDDELIDGTLVDEAGRPIAGAGWDYEPHGRRGWEGQHTDEYGRFVARRHSRDPDAFVRLWFRKEGFREAWTDPISWGTRNVTVEMQRTPRAEVMVLDAQERTPITEYALRILRLDGRGAGPAEDVCRLPVRFQGTHDGGRLVLDGLDPGSYLVAVVPEGDREHAMSRFHRMILDEADQNLTVFLERKAKRSVVVVRGHEPVRGTEIELLDQEVVLPLLRRPYPGVCVVSRATSDGDGGAVISGDPRCLYEVRVLGPGHAPLRVRDVRLDVEEALVIEVGGGAAVRGSVGPMRVLDQLAGRGPGYDAWMKRVPEHRRGMWDGVPRLRLDAADPPEAGGAPWAGRGPEVVHPDGTFVFEDVPAGDYDLILEMQEFLTAGTRTIRRYTLETVHGLAEGEKRVLQIDLSRLEPSRLEGTVLLDGRVPGGRAFLEWRRRGEPERTKHVQVEDGGRFECFLEPGHWAVRLAPTGEWANLLPLVGAIEVSPGGTVSPVLHFEGKRVRLRCVAPEGEDLAGVRLVLRRSGEGQGGEPPRVWAVSGGDGVAEAWVPPGRWEVAVEDVHPASGNAERRELGELVVQAGDSVVERTLVIPEESGYR